MNFSVGVYYEVSAQRLNIKLLTVYFTKTIDIILKWMKVIKKLKTNTALIK